MRHEARLQRDIRKYIALHGFRSVAVPNGAVLAGNGKQRAIQMNALKRDGLCVGFPDLIVFAPDGRIGFIEVKIEGGVQSDNQKAVETWLREWGFPCVVCRSLEDVKETFDRWGWL